MELIIQSKWPQANLGEIPYNITACGPGLKQRVLAGQITDFLINSQKVPNKASLNVTITGPIKTKIQYANNGDGTCLVSYTPVMTGRYIINVVYNDESHIYGSPFIVQAYPIDNPDLSVANVKCLDLDIGPNG